MGFSKEKTFNNVPTDFLGPPRPPQGPYKNKIVRKTRKTQKIKNPKIIPLCVRVSPCGALREPMEPMEPMGIP